LSSYSKVSFLLIKEEMLSVNYKKGSYDVQLKKVIKSTLTELSIPAPIIRIIWYYDETPEWSITKVDRKLIRSAKKHWQQEVRSKIQIFRESKENQLEFYFISKTRRLFAELVAKDCALFMRFKVIKELEQPWCNKHSCYLEDCKDHSFCDTYTPLKHVCPKLYLKSEVDQFGCYKQLCGEDDYGDKSSKLSHLELSKCDFREEEVNTEMQEEITNAFGKFTLGS
jgi:hypothetical protein